MFKIKKQLELLDKIDNRLSQIIVLLKKERLSTKKQKGE